MGKFCPNCGNNIEDESSFCGKCGCSMENKNAVNNVSGVTMVNNKLPINGMIIAGFILGILSILLCSLVVLALPLAILAVIFSINGLKKVKDGTSSGKGLAIAGLVTGCIGLLIFLIMLFVVIFIFAVAGLGY